MTIDVRDGVTVIDGAPRVLVTADYPYYRDDPAVWADRLRALRDDLGIEVITSYLPWRHHQPVMSMEPDFTDVVRFFRICHELGLKVIAKPGPFIHAETDFGGLPDWVCPERNPEIEPLLDAWGQPSRWAGLTLPAPLGAAFAAHAGQWLAAVGKQVLDAATYPDGPVIMMQIANEGLFTNGALPLSAYDYSPSGLAFFRECLREWYGTLEEYNRTHATACTSWADPAPALAGAGSLSLGQLQSFADWGRFHARYLHEVYRRWADAVGCRVPVVVNLNPPTVEDLDAWLARVRPGTWDGIHYGFTNWMGVVSASPDAHARYVIAAKLAPGPNMEENWGFSELYDRAYADATTSYHQTLLAMAAGATGFNVYTGASTSTWTSALDSRHAAPYPDCAPIAADGTPTEKAPVVKALADFFALHGPEFLTATPATSAAFGLYTPYAAIAAHTPPPPTPNEPSATPTGPSGLPSAPPATPMGSTSDVLPPPHATSTRVPATPSPGLVPGVAVPGCGRPLRAFHDRMRAAGHDYAIVDLETVTLDELTEHATLTVPGGPFMHRHVQDLLTAYVTQGGTLHLDGPAPTLDEHLLPYTPLTATPAGPSQLSGPPPQSGPMVVYGKADAYLRTLGDVAYLTVLVAADNDGPVRVDTVHGQVEVVTCKGGAAVIRLVNGEADDFIVKGLNAFLDSAVPAAITVAGTTTTATHPADLARIANTLTTLT